MNICNNLICPRTATARMLRKRKRYIFMISIATLAPLYLFMIRRFSASELTSPEMRITVLRNFSSHVDNEIFSWIKKSSDFEIRWSLLRDEIAQGILKSTKLSNDVLKSTTYTQFEIRRFLKQSRDALTERHDPGIRSILSKYLPPNVKIEKVDIDEFLLKPVITPFEISYKNNQSSLCAKQKNIRYIIAVPTAPGNFKRRNYVRHSERTKFANDAKNGAKLVFFTGVPNPSSQGNESKNVQHFIEKEQSKYGDIVQATFIDTYGNITSKSALMLSWSKTFCSSAEFVIRTDDDVELNITTAIAALENKSKQLQHFILGRGTPTTDAQKLPSNKYHVPVQQWPYRDFPNFLLGGALGLPVKTGAMLLEAMRRLPFVWLDDVFLTGMCTQSLGVLIFNHPAFFFQHKNKEIDK